MVTGSYISIITLNVNGLNAPTKRFRLAHWIQMYIYMFVCVCVCVCVKIHIYAVYKKPTSDLGINTDCKWEDGKVIPHKRKSNESCSSNTHIRQKHLKKMEETKSDTA